MSKPDGRMLADSMAWTGKGLPLEINMQIFGNLTASQTDLGRWHVPDAYLQNQYNQSVTIVAVDIHAFTKGVGGTGSDVFILKKVDIAGNVLSTIGTITVPANTKHFRADLRTPNFVGTSLGIGEGIRLDTGTIGAGYSTYPANITVAVHAEGFAVKG